MVSIHTLHELEASQQKLDKLIDLINVSIHTLHELEARKALSRQTSPAQLGFPFIRFTNWKQDDVILSSEQNLGACVSIHTLHELEASSRAVVF